MHRRIQFSFLALLIFATSYASATNSRSDECKQTASMRVYSNAWIDKETGDLNGFELAIKDSDDAAIDALLYMYEGGVAKGIPLPGHISGGRIEIGGDWIEQLVEYPSKKETTHTRFVKIDGVLKPTFFRGKIRIQDYDDFDVKLKKVGHIWMCRP